MEISYSVSERTETANLLRHMAVMWAVLWVTDLVVIDCQPTMGYGHI